MSEELNPALPADICEAVFFGIFGLPTQPVELLAHPRKATIIDGTQKYAFKWLSHLNHVANLECGEKSDVWPEPESTFQIIAKERLLKATVERIKPYLLLGGAIQKDQMAEAIEKVLGPHNHSLLRERIRTGKVGKIHNGTYHILECARRALRELDAKVQLNDLGELIEKLDESCRQEEASSSQPVNRFPFKQGGLDHG